MSFSFQILAGLMLGILLGLFLGELASGFSVPGEIYIALLQMTVLPYILVSLVGNLGRVSWQKSRKLIIAGMLVLGFLLALGIINNVVPAVVIFGILMGVGISAVAGLSDHLHGI